VEHQHCSPAKKWLNSNQIGVIFLLSEVRNHSNDDGLKTVKHCIYVTQEIVSKPDFESKSRMVFFAPLMFVIRFTCVMIAIALLSCVLMILNIMSVFAVSTALEDFPVSEVLLAQP